MQLVVVENPLVEYITAAREATTSAFGGVRSVVESGVSSWIGFERNVERESLLVLFVVVVGPTCGNV